MAPEKLSDDLVALLRLVHEHGASYCSGTCEHRKPGELHCHTMGQILKISSTGAKRRRWKLVQMGLMNRHRFERENGHVVAKFTVSSEGLDLLQTLDKTDTSRTEPGGEKSLSS